jgi:Mn-dependent DtxR family transcriptional regulator
MTKDKEVSRIADVQERLKMSKSNVQQYRARLIDHGLIAVIGCGSIKFQLLFLGVPQQH